jgi:hypothetical protein
MMVPSPWSNRRSSLARWGVAAVAFGVACIAGCKGEDPSTAVAALEMEAQAPEADAGAPEAPGDVPSAPPESAIAVENDATDAPEAPDVPDADASSTSPPLCVRLDDPRLPAKTAELSLLVQRAYVRAVYLDCDVAEMIATDEDTLSDFENALVAWNLQFWGCNGQTTTTLGIVRAGFDEITSTDAARLVDHYVEAATGLLSMSSSEQLSMRDALAHLVAMADVRPSDQFSLSRCNALDASDEMAGDGDVDGER